MMEKHGSLIYGTEDEIMEAIREKERQELCDAISREAVVDRIKREEKIFYTPIGMNSIIRSIEQLPPVIPKSETVTEFADRCRECGKMKKSQDAISREAVKEIINDIRDCISVEGYCAILERLKKLPSVTPSRRKGRWIKSRDCYGNNHFTCPFCEHDIATKAENWDDNYCPNCGAEMESEEV